MPHVTPLPPARPRPRIDRVDLLVVGALTIDRFEDGSTAPGGSVLHAARAAAAIGMSVGVVTAAGSEPEARAASRELAMFAALHVQPVAHTLRFAHRETDEGRQLLLEVLPPPLCCPPVALEPGALLYAPVAGELGSDLGGQRYTRATTAAILQGWLRSLEPGERVHPLPLEILPPPLIDVLSGLDLLIASREDLPAAAGGPPEQLRALRSVFGPRPVLVVTAGADGSWLALQHVEHIPAPRIVQEVSTVGAGDAFAAVMVARLAQGESALAAAREAANAVAEMLIRRLA
jgi:sugar/nucleoside kinase (ribokinase family)